MKILIGILKYPPDFTGGGGPISIMYDRLLAEGKIDRVTVLTTTVSKNVKAKVSDTQNVIRLAYNPYVELERSLSGKIRKAIFVLTTSFKAVGRYFKEYKEIDVVHTVDSSWLSTVIAWCAILTKKPFVREIVLLGADDPLYLSRAKAIFTRWFFLQPFQRANRIITISHALKKACIQYGIAESKVWARFNPIYMDGAGDTEESRRIMAQVDDRPALLVVGRISRRKDQAFLIRAANELKTDAQLLLAGPFEDDAVKAQVEALAEDVHRSHNHRISIKFLGMVHDRSTLRKLYTRADLFWFSSRREGLGNVILESLLCGTPVLTKPVQGLMHELITHEEDGKVIDTNEPKVFADITEQWLKKDIDAEMIRRRAENRFNPRRIELGYIEQFGLITK